MGSAVSFLSRFETRRGKVPLILRPTPVVTAFARDGPISRFTALQAPRDSYCCEVLCTRVAQNSCVPSTYHTAVAGVAHEVRLVFAASWAQARAGAHAPHRGKRPAFSRRTPARVGWFPLSTLQGFLHCPRRPQSHFRVAAFEPSSAEGFTSRRRPSRSTAIVPRAPPASASASKRSSSYQLFARLDRWYTSRLCSRRHDAFMSSAARKRIVQAE